MKLLSNSFSDGGTIDPRYAMEAIPGGQNLSPHLRIEDVPSEAKSLAITCIDHHPVANNWVHWMVVNVPPDVNEIPEGASGTSMPGDSLELDNTFGFQGYGGPRPPAGTGVHDYEFTVYALTATFKAEETQITEKKFLSLIDGKVAAKASLTAGFENKG